MALTVRAPRNSFSTMDRRFSFKSSVACSTVALLCAATVTYGKLPPGSRIVSVSSFEEIVAKQKGQHWCWAACIQMAFLSQGVHLSQKDLVEKLGHEGPASNEDVARIVDELKGDDWRGDWRHLDKAPKPGYVLTELENDRPILIGYRATPNSEVLHAAMLYSVLTVPVSPDKAPPGKKDTQMVAAFTIYNPATGKSEVWRGREFYERVKQTFFLSVKRE